MSLADLQRELAAERIKRDPTAARRNCSNCGRRDSAVVLREAIHNATHERGRVPLCHPCLKAHARGGLALARRWTLLDAGPPST
jgi:hypothetical protein